MSNELYGRQPHLAAEAGWQPEQPTGRPAAALVGVSIFALLFAAALLWAKWLPYLAKTVTLSGSHRWSGKSILTVGGVAPGDAPSWHAATSFFAAYLRSIWKALVAAVLVSAAIQALLPRGWAARLINRRAGWRSATVAALAGTPSMMCTCCTAPVAASLRREGVGVAGVVAYWLANPLLNPAVIAFLAFVAPWQWAVTRVVVGGVVVVAGSALVARFVTEPAPQPGSVPQPAQPPQALDIAWLTAAPARFGRAIARLILSLLPEYAAVVLLIGALRGWMFPLGRSDFPHAGLVIVLVSAVVGTLLVIPTAGEIPIAAGLATAGLSLGGTGALLLTLPAASLPAMAMLVRSLGWRATAATAAVVAVGGVLAGGLLTVLS
jgi:uncharacterized membrane protein YraQ (UPF0718 family)